MQTKASKNIAIAIDGPAGAGKSTTAKLVAVSLGYLHIDTGAMYRAIALKVLRHNIPLDDVEKISSLAQNTEIRLVPSNTGPEVLLDGESVTSFIRIPEVSQAASKVSAIAGVRTVMVREQQRLAQHGGVVLEGRDIGTVVLPHAELKIFMVADIHERAKRRMAELAQTGIPSREEDVLHDLELRDQQDSTRSVSPLRKADDAVEVDTSHLTIEQQVQFIVDRAIHVIGGCPS
jgi:cytidylate kinase